MSIAEQLAAEIAVLDQRIETLEAELARAYRVHQVAIERGKAGRFDYARQPEGIERELDGLRQRWLDLHDQLTREFEDHDQADGLNWSWDDTD